MATNTGSEQRAAARTTPEQGRVSVVDIESGVEFSGDIHNVSLAGLLFHAKLQPVVGADMALRFEYPNAPTLYARMNVVRVEPHENGFDIAGKLRR